MKEKETHPKLQETIIDSLKSIRVNRVPAINRYNNFEFDVGLSLAGIFHTQKSTGWKNFMLGRWSPKWKEAQRRHYIRIGSKKSAKQWTIAILHKLLLLQNNLWQFRNKILHSPTGPTAVASHHSLNYQVGEQFTLNTDGILEGSHFFFSSPYTLDSLYSTSAEDKVKWLQQVGDARSCYEAPDDPHIRQLRSQQAYMNNYLITNGGFTFIPEHVQPVAIQDNHISTDYLVSAMSSYLATSGYLSATSVASTLVALEAVVPVPPDNDDPIVVAAPASKRQQTLDDHCSPAASVAAAPVAVETVAPVPPADDDPSVVSTPASKQ